ncbi:hypothetical protein CF133_18810, partial [Aeromonas salmonicida]
QMLEQIAQLDVGVAFQVECFHDCVRMGAKRDILGPAVGTFKWESTGLWQEYLLKGSALRYSPASLRRCDATT